MLTVALERLLTNEASDRSTVTLVRGAITGIKTMVDAETQLQAQAEAIAKLLDVPRLQAVLSAAADDVATKGPFVAGALIIASEAGHDTITTRHVIASVIRGVTAALAKRGLPGVAESERIDALFGAIPRRDGTTLVYAPRLIGALAAAIAENDERLVLVLTRECFDGDPAVASVLAALEEAKARLGAAMKAEKESATE